MSDTSTNLDSDVGKYYKCNSNSKIKADNSTTILSEMALQPFAKFNNGTKGDSKYTDFSLCILVRPNLKNGLSESYSAVLSKT